MIINTVVIPLSVKTFNCKKKKKNHYPEQEFSLSQCPQPNLQQHVKTDPSQKFISTMFIPTMQVMGNDAPFSLQVQKSSQADVEFMHRYKYPE